VIDDREGDIYEKWARLPDRRTHLLSRACRDRAIAGGGRLFATMAAFPEQHRFTLDLPARPGKRQARQARLSVRDAYADQIRKVGGEVVGTTGIPLGTADMTPALSKISGNFDGLLGIFFGTDGVTVGNQAYDLGLTGKYKWAGDGAIAESTNLPALGNKIEGFVGINRYLPVLEGPLNTAANKKFLEEASVRLKKIDSSGPLPDRFVQSNYEAMNALKLGMEKSGFRGREDTMKLIEALEGLEMKEGDDFPQGDKVLRKEDHQAFVREFIFEINGGKHRIVETVEKEKTFFPPACKFAAA